MTETTAGNIFTDLLKGSDLLKQRCYIYINTFNSPEEKHLVELAKKDLEKIEQLEKEYLDYLDLLFKKTREGSEISIDDSQQALCLGMKLNNFKCFEA